MACKHDGVANGGDGNLNTCGVVYGGCTVWIVVVDFDDSTIAVGDGHDTAEVVLVIVIILSIAVHGEDVINGDSVDVGNPPLPILRWNV